MRYRFPNATSSMSAGSLSSMIDIVFLLIIFFVVTASFDREQIDPAVALPTIASAPIKQLPPERLMVNVLADGSVRCGFHHIATSNISSRLVSILKSMNARQTTVLIINGDRNTPHKYISAVLAVAARAGYNQVRINAEIKTGEK